MLADNVHSNLRDERKRAFDESEYDRRSTKLAKLKEELCKPNQSHPEREEVNIHNLSIPVKKMREPPFFVEREKMYVFVLRHSPAQNVDLEPDEERHLLIWKFETIPSLLKSELQALQLTKTDNTFKELIATEKEYFDSIMVTKLPEDAKIQKIKRFDHNVDTGCLLEVWVKKQNKLDKSSLKAPRLKNIASSVVTPVNHFNGDEDVD